MTNEDAIILLKDCIRIFENGKDRTAEKALVYLEQHIEALNKAIYALERSKEVKISDIKKWVNDYLKWYKKTYNIEEDIFIGTPYGIQNQHTLDILTSIFEHMEDDLENDRAFAEQSKDFYTKLVSKEECNSGLDNGT